MVFLSKIYTKTGDDGTTALGTGDRIAKTEPRIRSYGGVDELNSVLGLALAHGVGDPYAGWLRRIQNDLFDLGADLCIPEAAEVENALRVTDEQVTRLEEWIDSANEQLQPLKSFILPGGQLSAAYLHLGRTVCRRTEIGVLELHENEAVNPAILKYLNRLSDLLFVLARACNASGKDDVLWVPGEGRDGL